MIGPRIFATTGQFVLTNVGENAAAALVMQSRLKSGTGVTWGLRKRLTGTGDGTTYNGVTVVDASAAPRSAFTNMATMAAVSESTPVTATALPQLHSIICDGCDVILDVLSVTGNGVLEIEMAPITGGT
ncbi:MAG TPA: hypothetical protein DGD08_08525 [Gemmatimonas aurantiaca]|uniref:Uncharacterized protein n=2 Tax=Gemmatimonas aurantiaca TaxID=173480 RepID=C1A447_GEMAT|nr:hypothetical protein [Gemmatimonas aurantiaca]BAH38872.1 hypothetical protein GAU_1830 [Gemmatimonas aurantiaca T-27]HCT57243.1 hypothetical protein [Gemmatimonas aurantiaca]